MYEDLPQAVRLVVPQLAASLDAEYLDGYFRQRRIAEEPRARMISDIEDRFAFAERYVRPQPEIATLRSTLGSLESTLGDVEPELAIGDQADRLQLVYEMYEALFAHAAASGWLDAERSRPADPAAAWKPPPPQAAARPAGRKRR